MAKRTELHERLCEIMTAAQGESGRKRVYYQPPPNFQMSYPCVVYALSSIHTNFADNAPYLRKRRYTVTVMDKNPDSTIPDRVLALPQCGFDRAYTADNLNHWVMTLYY